MYDASDPRSRLAAPGPSAAPAAVEFAAAEYAKFYETQPQESGAGGRTWYARGQNYLVAYTEAEPGAAFERSGQPDEYAIIIPDAATKVEISAWRKSRASTATRLRSFHPATAR
jgi:hypothetical protein